MNTVIKVENLSKLYRLGEVGTGTLSHDLNRWWARVRGKEDPFARVGQVNDRTKEARKGEYVWALKDIDFEVKQGEVLGIIGKNGAGKSTLLKLLSRVTAPTTGSIKAKGRIASLLEVGTGMHPEMTGRENVYLNGTILGMTKKEVARKFDDIMDFAGCTKYADTPVKRYSSGMTVRLGFAVAAFLEPEILIVDEVLAVGDVEFQRRAIGKMKDVSQQEGRTVLFVSHNMQSVDRLCSKGLVLRDGGISFMGSQTHAINHYISQNIESSKSNNYKHIGSGEVIVTNVKLKDLQEREISSIYLVQSFKVEIEYSFKDKQFDVTALRFGVKISNALGVPLFFHYSRLVDFNHDNEEIKKGKLCCCLIKGLSLNHGIYSLSVSVFKDNQHIDVVEDAISFEILPGRAFNYIEIPSVNHSLTLGHAEWYLSQ